MLTAFYRLPDDYLARFPPRVWAESIVQSAGTSLSAGASLPALGREELGLLACAQINVGATTGTGGNALERVRLLCIDATATAEASLWELRARTTTQALTTEQGQAVEDTTAGVALRGSWNPRFSLVPIRPGSIVRAQTFFSGSAISGHTLRVSVWGLIVPRGSISP